MHWFTDSTGTSTANISLQIVAEFHAILAIFKIELEKLIMFEEKIKHYRALRKLGVKSSLAFRLVFS